jgi:hypothetical protein
LRFLQNVNIRIFASMPTKASYILKRRPLFWSVSDEQLSRISDTLLVETILNYGTLEDVRELFHLLGVFEVANIFRKSLMNRSRHNYFPEVANFFHLYFNRHAPGDTV